MMWQTTETPYQQGYAAGYTVARKTIYDVIRREIAEYPAPVIPKKEVLEIIKKYSEEFSPEEMEVQNEHP